MSRAFPEKICTKLICKKDSQEMQAMQETTRGLLLKLKPLKNFQGHQDC